MAGQTGSSFNLGCFGNGIVRVMATAALEVGILRMCGKTLGGIQLLFMAGCTEFRFSLTQHRRMFRAMREVAEVTLARCQIGMGLFDGHTMIVMTGITGLRDRSDQQIGITAGM